MDPTVALRQFEYCTLLGELEETVAATVDDLVDVLGSKRVKAQVKHVVSEMEIGRASCRERVFRSV